jgi:two-component system, OmpR family, sensor histidine kinase MprB
MSLRTRIAVAAATAVAAGALGLGTIGYLANRTKLIGEIHQELRQRAQALLSAHRHDDDHRDPARDPRDGPGGCGSFASVHLAAPDLGGARGYFQFVCSDGKVAAEQGGTDLPVTPRALQVARQGQGSSFSSGYVQRAHVEILTIADQRGRAIEVALPLAGVDSTLHSLLVTYLILGGIGALLAGAAGMIIGRAAVAPLSRFSKKTESVTSSLHQPRRLEENRR